MHMKGARSKQVHLRLIVLTVWTLFFGVGCGRQDDGVIRRMGEPDYVEKYNKERMDAAMAEAKSTLDTFIAALKKKTPEDKTFAVKKSFDYGSDGKEFIWINEVRLVDSGFEGKINNEPVNDIGVELGETVKVNREDVADWMYMSEGRLNGGYTIVALVYDTPDQAKFEKAMGIDWTNYKFLKQGK